MDDSFSDIVITPPAIAAVAEHLYLAWTGTNRRINLLVADAQALHAPVVLTERSARSPAVTDSGHGVPVLAWTGSDRRVNLLTLREQQPGTHLRLEEARSALPPAVCGHQGNLMAAWTGSDGRLNLASL